jgi:serine/threonine protein kinase
MCKEYLPPEGSANSQSKSQSNILVDEAGHVKLADFGLSILFIEGHITATTSSGTYRWSAPELFAEGDVHRTPPSDVYSFSCVCLEVLINYYTTQDQTC